ARRSRRTARAPEGPRPRRGCPGPRAPPRLRGDRPVSDARRLRARAHRLASRDRARGQGDVCLPLPPDQGRQRLAPVERVVVLLPEGPRLQPPAQPPPRPEPPYGRGSPHRMGPRPQRLRLSQRAGLRSRQWLPDPRRRPDRRARLAEGLPAGPLGPAAAARLRGRPLPRPPRPSSRFARGRPSRPEDRPVARSRSGSRVPVARFFGEQAEAVRVLHPRDRKGRREPPPTHPPPAP